MNKLIITQIIFLMLITYCNFSDKEKNSPQQHDSGEIIQLIIAQDNYINELCNYGENLEKLNEAQMIFYFNQNLEREVNNGGFYQYFYNSSGDFAHETVDALKEIGADKTASLLQEAINQFPDKSVPKNREERIDFMQNIDDNTNNIWDTLDQAFYDYEDDLNALNYEFIKKNKKYFNNNN